MAVTPWRAGLICASLAALAGCEDFEGGNIFAGLGQTSEPADTNPAAVRSAGSVRVVEAPEIFDVTDTALWDGRPSFGQIWVAYEGADPTNVIIRNEENGKFVVGALYRRERFFPGPPFQLSSDAAAELGILAGRPTQIKVTALSEERIEPEPEAEVAAEDGADVAIEKTGGALTVGAPEVETLDPIAAAAAAIDAVDPDGAVPGDAQAIDAVSEPAVPPRRPTIEGPNAPLPRRVVQTVEAEPAETLEQPQPDAELAVSEPISNPIAVPKRGVSGLDKPFIQVGIFSILENAEATVKRLSDAGIIPLIEEQQIGGRTFYRVVVGPAGDVIERATLLKQVQDQGFTDAYFVKN
jgi:cell division septation protein DedD